MNRLTSWKQAPTTTQSFGQWWRANKYSVASAACIAAVVGQMVVLTMLTLGSLPSGPVAERSGGAPAVSSISVPGHDPYTIASRVDHGLFVSEVGE
jgi:hypothetical protein